MDQALLAHSEFETQKGERRPKRRLSSVTEFSTSSMTTARPLTTQSRARIVSDFRPAGNETGPQSRPVPCTQLQLVALNCEAMNSEIVFLSPWLLQLRSVMFG